MCYTEGLVESVPQLKEADKMSIQGRIEELSSKHRDLDIEIKTQQKQPSIDTLLLTKLKRQKLRIKEQLATLSG
ncbi:MAG: DUF465 domain-containing protein [Hyphomonadaceae bacterium]